MSPSEPEANDIPKIGAHSTVVSLGLNTDNTIEVPPVSEPMQAGWYSHGPTPGETGPAVILGHVDGNNQRAIFFRIKELAAADHRVQKGRFRRPFHGDQGGPGRQGQVSDGHGIRRHCRPRAAADHVRRDAVLA
jgi:hypothetical protein